MENFSFFSKNIKTYLFAKEITKDQLTDILGVGAPSTVGKWISENRPPKGSSMKMLSQLIGFSEHDLIHKDLTIDIIQSTKYSTLDLAAEGIGDYITRHSQLKLYVEHIESIHIRLLDIVSEGKKVIESTK